MQQSVAACPSIELRRDPLTAEQRRKTMQRVHSTDTHPEMVVRRLVHGMGYRYRLHVGDLPGKPDMVFSRRHKVIFVHGCFWHRHDCHAGRKMPVTNNDYWARKLARNQARDAENYVKLQEQGWEVTVVWECETRDLDRLAVRLCAFLEGSS
jgi:DNA mismatch endonuclease (patch repair protein)